jgi:hypothetical protein
MMIVAILFISIFSIFVYRRDAKFCVSTTFDMDIITIEGLSSATAVTTTGMSTTAGETAATATAAAVRA